MRSTPNVLVGDDSNREQALAEFCTIVENGGHIYCHPGFLDAFIGGLEAADMLTPEMRAKIHAHEMVPVGKLVAADVDALARMGFM